MTKKKTILDVHPSNVVFWETPRPRKDHDGEYTRLRSGIVIGKVPANQDIEELYPPLKSVAKVRKKIRNNLSVNDRLLVQVPRYGQLGQELEAEYYAIRLTSVFRSVDIKTGETVVKEDFKKI